MFVADFFPMNDAEPGVRLMRVDTDPVGLLLMVCALRTGRLPKVRRAALEARAVPADRLEVELTESGVMRDAEVAVAELTTLKIDRSFVAA